MDIANTPERPMAAPVPETGSELQEAQESKEQAAEKGPQSEPVPESPPAEEKPPVDLATVVAKAPSKPEPPAKDAYHQRVERVLEDGLVDEYLTLTPEKRRQFKQEGERVAVAIRQMFNQSKIKVKEVLKLILNWLRILPNPNKWFLEQEAKIKTDRIIALAEEKRKEESGL